MTYVGRGVDAISNVEKLDNITFNGGTTYNLTKSSVAFTPSGANNILVSIDGVVQQGNFTVAGSTIIFDFSTTSNNTCNFIMHYGIGVLNISADDSISTAKLQNDSVTLAKMASGTDGNIISYDASGNPVAIATGNDGQVLTSTGAGSPPAFETVSGTTINNNADNRVISGSGTANTLEGEANLQFDGTNLGIGKSPSRTLDMTSNGDYFINLNDGTNASVGSTNRGVNLYAGGSIPMYLTSSKVGITNAPDLGTGLHIKTADSGASVDANADELVLENSGDTGLSLLSGTSGSGKIAFGDSGDNNIGLIQYDHANNLMMFFTNGAERTRILNGGEVIINRTSTFFGGNILQIVGKNDAEVVAIAVATNGKKAIQFANAGLSDVGNIVTSSSSVAYNTSSDYRLKENETPITDGITRLKTLKPYRFNWLADNDENGNPTQTVDGFFAHEVTAVPEAINGTKDAMHPEVLYTADDELPEGKEIGDVKEVAKPNHQSIDQSKLVPLLVASLQEAITKIETLEAKVTALENA